jgi:hypothetical protein
MKEFKSISNLHHLHYKANANNLASRFIWLVAFVLFSYWAFSLLYSGKWLGGVLFLLIDLVVFVLLGWSSQVEWDEERVQIRTTLFGVRKSIIYLAWSDVKQIKHFKSFYRRIPRHRFIFADGAGRPLCDTALYSEDLLGLLPAIQSIAQHKKIVIVDDVNVAEHTS